jgi:hypothetical protein
MPRGPKPRYTLIVGKSQWIRYRSVNEIGFSVAELMMNGTHTGNGGPKNPKEPENDQSCNLCRKDSEIGVFETPMNSEYSERKENWREIS